MINKVACENTKPGDPPSDWQVNGIGDSTIQGFATSMSVNVGQTVNFKIKTPASSYHIDILRLGYYGGDGARLIASNIKPTASLPQTQPNCLTNSSTGLVDCGNWNVSASWTVPSEAVSGLYIAHLVRNDTGGESQIFFVVREDSSHSDLVLKTSDTTWQAYNDYGGNSLYTCTVSCPPGQPGRVQGRLRGLLQPPVRRDADHGRRPLRSLLCRVPADPLPRAQRLRHELCLRPRPRGEPRAAPEPQGRHLERPRRVLVRRANARRWNRPAARG